MSSQELQEEEIEVLESIYEGDSCFKKVSPTTFQYKYGEENGYRSLMVEIVWGDDYPDSVPSVNMDIFYNKHIIDSVKEAIKSGILEQAEEFLGTAMTYTLFEWVKENYDDLVTDQPESAPVKSEEKPEKTEVIEEGTKKKEKKEQLSKHQKRRLYEKMGNATGEKPRGWDWVDIVKHLSQTGSSQN